MISQQFLQKTIKVSTSASDGLFNLLEYKLSLQKEYFEFFYDFFFILLPQPLIELSFY